MHDSINNSGQPRSRRPRGKLTPEQLQNRLDKFGMLAGDLVPESTRSRRLLHYGHQLVRCSSSAGASYSEARSATTPREFEHKLHECAKELRESMSWLNQVAHATRQPLVDLRDECDELVAILISSIQTTRRKNEAARRANANQRKNPP